MSGLDHQDHVNTATDSAERRIVIALFLTGGYMVAEAIGGLVFNSLALLADAGHLVSDAMALGLCWFAIRIGKRSPTDRHTFGFRRGEIIAALLNGLSLWAIVGIIGYEAVHRFLSPSPVAGKGMLVVATVGLIVNIFMAGLLFKTRRDSLNLKAAFLHVISDALGSVGALTAAAVIVATNRYEIDPIVGLLICVLILYSSWSLINESFQILMEGVPLRLHLPEIETAILHLAGVCCVYDLHVWSISSDRIALSAHVVLSEPLMDRQELLKALNGVLTEQFGINHTTFQVETTHELRRMNGQPACREGTLCDCTRDNS